MTFRRALHLGAIASASLLAGAPGARADYFYTDTPSASVVAPNFTEAVFTAGLGTKTGSTNTVDLQDVLFIPVGTPPPSFSGTAAFLTQVFPSPSLTPASNFNVSGLFSVTYSGGMFSATYPGTVTPSGTVNFSLTNVHYVSLSNTTGQIVGTIGPISSVPEPASLVMAGTAALAGLGYGYKRWRRGG